MTLDYNGLNLLFTLRDAGNDRPSRYQNYRKNDQRKFSNSEAKTNEPLSPQYDREEYQQDDRNYEHHRGKEIQNKNLLLI